MRKAALIACLSSCFCLIVLCWPAGTSAKPASTAHSVRKAHKHKASADKQGPKTAKRNRVRTAERKSQKVAIEVPQRTDAVRERVGRSAASREVAGRGEEESSEYIEYKVKRGDTVEKLARLFRFEQNEFTELNRVAGKKLKPGKVVFIPKPEERAEDVPIVLNGRPARPWSSEEERGILVKVAKSFAGAPYRYGGNSVRGLDCSGFVRKMYEIFEVELPRSAREQFCAGPRVSKDDLATGDLVFFKTRPFASYPTHVGIYIGSGSFIHASSGFGGGVKIDRLSEAYFLRTFMGAVRIKGPPSQDEGGMDDNQRKASNDT
jgi:peptidoglycan DL-endopeptidase LytE